MEPEVTITPYRDGPLLVRGPARIVDQNGREIETGREVVALCRCGKSRLRPLCDGTHKRIGFTAPSVADDSSGPDPRAGADPRALDALQRADR